MRIVRRRVMRSAGASTIGKRTNLAAAIVLALLLLCLPLMSALPAHECSPAFLRVQCGFDKMVAGFWRL